MKKLSVLHKLSLGLGIVCNLSCSNETTKGFSVGGHGDTKRSVTLNTINGDVAANWKKDTDKNIYINSRKIDLTGTCAALGSFLVFIQNKITDLPARCDKNSNFSWSHTVDVDGRLAVVFKASDNLALGTFNIIVDTIAPPTPIITTNNGANFAVLNPHQLIEGTTSEDTFKILSDDPNGQITLTGTHFELDTLLGFAVTKTFAISAVDLAGNHSPSAHITIQYQATATLVSTAFSGAGLPSGTFGRQGLAKLEAITVGPIVTTTLSETSTPGLKKLNTGFVEVNETQEEP